MQCHVSARQRVPRVTLNASVGQRLGVVFEMRRPTDARDVLPRHGAPRRRLRRAARLGTLVASQCHVPERTLDASVGQRLSVDICMRRRLRRLTRAGESTRVVDHADSLTHAGAAPVVNRCHIRACQCHTRARQRHTRACVSGRAVERRYAPSSSAPARPPGQGHRTAVWPARRCSHVQMPTDPTAGV